MGKLILVPTPVGNLEDISLRALKVLKECDLILAEDTRKTGNLLKHFDISNKLQSHHQHNEHQSIEAIIEKLQSGLNIAVVTDAGTPGISDPGFLLSRECIKQGIEVECLPGATALIPALMVSGLPADKFTFEGFLPHKKGRKSKLESMKESNYTMIFYESPYRILKTLEQFAENFGNNRQVSVSRELSKIHEETIRGSLEEVIHHFKTHTIKGEFVIVLAGK